MPALPETYAVGASIGAPPDDFNLQGQNWGLPPLNPDALVESAYAPFIATLRANMRHAGALRVDHVMPHAGKGDAVSLRDIHDNEERSGI